jgi:hypothetical protein
MASQRQLITRGLQTWLQGVIDPNTSATLYQYVKRGHILDPGTISGLWADVVYFQGKSGPAGSGGNMVGWRIEDNPIWVIETGYIYELDTTVAIDAVMNAADILLPAIHSHYLIPNPDNPSVQIGSVYSVLESEYNDRGMPLRYPNGHSYYVWSTYVTVKQQYNVTLVTP